MARNVQHEFVNVKDTDALVADLTSAYERITDTIVRPASPEKLFIQWVAYILLLERAKINQVGNANLPSRAENDDLNALGEDIYNLPRPKATTATVMMRFTISEAQNSNILIPKGTRVTDMESTVYFETVDDAFVEAGQTSADVRCICQESGVIGNEFTPGQINRLVDIFEYYESCENITESDGGSDAPNDDEYYDLLVASMDAWSTAGPKGAYEYYAKQVSTEIADVVAKQPDPGYVKIYALMDDGTIATQEVKDAILKACSAEFRRPLTDHVSVGDPELVKYNVHIKYFQTVASEKSAADLKADVETAVDNYVVWQQSKIGRDINPDKLRELVLAAGAKRLVVMEPEFTHLIDATEENESIPQVASIGTVTIENGGYEDE